MSEAPFDDVMDQFFKHCQACAQCRDAPTEAGFCWFGRAAMFAAQAHLQNEQKQELASRKKPAGL